MSEHVRQSVLADTPALGALMQYEQLFNPTEEHRMLREMVAELRKMKLSRKLRNMTNSAHSTLSCSASSVSWACWGSRFPTRTEAQAWMPSLP